MIDNTYNMENVPLESLVGTAVILDFTSKYEKAEPITVEDIKKDAFSREIKEGIIPVLRTDQTKKWGQKDFYDGPYLSEEAAEWLADRKIKACAYDFCEDYCVRKGAFRGEECVVHQVFLSRDIYNIEYLANLDKLTARIFTIIALPIKLTGVEGAIARVIAIETKF